MCVGGLVSGNLGLHNTSFIFLVLLALLWQATLGARWPVLAPAAPVRAASPPCAPERDPLTGLVGKAEFERHLATLMATGPGLGRHVAVMIFDLDRVKDINGFFGYDVGDQVLHEVGRRLAGQAGEAGMAARLASDRFALVRPEVEGTDVAGEIAAQALSSLAEEVCVDGYLLSPTASVGVAMAPDHGTGLGQLMRCAEMAGDDAKKAGGNRYRLFDPKMDSALRSRKAMERELRHALDRGDFVLHFQPQIDLASNRAIACEALIRWIHPVKGAIAPLNFIPTAETSGLIRPIGTWVLAQACKAARRWQDDGFDLVVAVNVSAAQLRQKDLVGVVARMLEEAGLPPQQLELEVTESLFVDPSQIIIRRNLAAFAELGVSLAIDDFGTGYSSLSYLKRLPVSRIKIDKSFLLEAGRGGPDDAIVRTIIALAHSFGKRVLAEGIENAEQQAFLMDEGCDEAQGCWFGRPVPEAEAIMEVRTRHAAPPARRLRAVG